MDCESDFPPNGRPMRNMHRHERIACGPAPRSDSGDIKIGPATCARKKHHKQRHNSRHVAKLCENELHVDPLGIIFGALLRAPGLPTASRARPGTTPGHQDGCKSLPGSSRRALPHCTQPPLGNFGTTLDRLGTVLGSSWDRFGVVLGSFGGRRGIILGSSSWSMGSSF